MRIAARVALAAVLTAGMVAASAAQQPRQGQRQGGGFGFGGQGPYSLLFGFTGDVNKALVEELKITDEQKDKLKEGMTPINEKRREMFKGFTPGERPSEEQQKKMREDGEKLAADTKKVVEDILKPEQTKRLKQISYQNMRVMAYANKDVQSELKFTDEQKEKVKDLMETYQKDAGELRRGGPRVQFGQKASEEDQKKLDEIQKKTQALAKEVEEKIAEKLTDEQKTKWKEMIGEKFDLAKLQQGFQRPRRDD